MSDSNASLTYLFILLWFRFGTMWKKRLKLVFLDRPPRVSGDKPSESFDKYRNNKVDAENCILLERSICTSASIIMSTITV